MVASSQLPPQTIREIARNVMQKHGVTMDDLAATGCRNRAITLARWEAFWLCRQAGISLARIGRFFGGIHHTSIIHGARCYGDWLAEKKVELDT